MPNVKTLHLRKGKSLDFTAAAVAMAEAIEPLERDAARAV